MWKISVAASMIMREMVHNIVILKKTAIFLHFAVVKYWK